MTDDAQVRKLLIVDDEPEVEVMFKQRLRREVRAGTYQLFFARSGIEALDVLRQSPDIGLVLTDLNMPGMGGLELLAALGANWPDVPSIVVSAYGDPAHVSEASELGAAGFVVKPVDFADLRDMLQRSMPE